VRSDFGYLCHQDKACHLLPLRSRALPILMPIRTPFR
jgi:hypothetical protein